MWGKKLLAGVWILCLCSALLLPVHAQAADYNNGATTLTTSVPSTHKVQLVIGEHGCIEVDGMVYRGTMTLDITRQSEQVYRIIPDAGWQVDSVTYGVSGSEITVEPSDSAYAAPALNQDGNVLTVTFKKISSDNGSISDPESGGESSGDTPGNVTSPQTGDIQNPGLYGIVLVSSLFLLIFLLKKKRKNGL